MHNWLKYPWLSVVDLRCCRFVYHHHFMNLVPTWSSFLPFHRETPRGSPGFPAVVRHPSSSLSEFIGQRQACRGRLLFSNLSFFAPSFHLCLCDVFQFLGLLNLWETSLLSVSLERKSFFQSLCDSSLLASRTVTVLKRHVRGGVWPRLCASCLVVQLHRWKSHSDWFKTCSDRGGVTCTRVIMPTSSHDSQVSSKSVIWNAQCPDRLYLCSNVLWHKNSLLSTVLKKNNNSQGKANKRKLTLANQAACKLGKV